VIDEDEAADDELAVEVKTTISEIDDAIWLTGREGASSTEVAVEVGKADKELMMVTVSAGPTAAVTPKGGTRHQYAMFVMVDETVTPSFKKQLSAELTRYIEVKQLSFRHISTP
jgi:hypothetical protein